MAGLNDDAQWIILLGLIISISIFFLALIVNEATLVGQTTAESVIDLPKSDVKDLKNEVRRLVESGWFTQDISNDIVILSMNNKTALVDIEAPFNAQPGPMETITIHYNNGVTKFNETLFY